MSLVIENKVIPEQTERWVEYDKDTEVLLRGLDDESYQVGLARVRRQIEKSDSKFKLGEVGVVDGEITEHKYQCRLLSTYIIKDWRGVKDSIGNDAYYSPSVGERVLTSNVDFFLFVVKSASEIAADAQKEVDETMGKSLPDSDGKSGEKN